MSEDQKRYAGTIDLTPSWRGTMRMLIELLTNSTPRGQAEAEKELMRLAAIADEFPQQLAAKDEAMAELASSLQEMTRVGAKPSSARDRGDEALAKYLGMSRKDVEHAAAFTWADLVLLKRIVDRARAAKFTVEADTLNFAEIGNSSRGFIVKHDGVPIGFFSQDTAPVGFVALMTEDATALSPVVSAGCLESVKAEEVDEVFAKLERARHFVRAVKSDAAADMPPLMKSGESSMPPRSR